MCGKTATYNLKWSEVYAYASALTPPAAPARRTPKIASTSPLPLASQVGAGFHGVGDAARDLPRRTGWTRRREAIWPFYPGVFRGPSAHQQAGPADIDCQRPPAHRGRTVCSHLHGRVVDADFRVLVVVSWFYEFDSRVKPQVPYAVFPTDAPFWLMAGLARRTAAAGRFAAPDGSNHHGRPERGAAVGRPQSQPGATAQPGRSLRCGCMATRSEALALLRPHRNETMGVEAVPMGIKIPGNQAIELPDALLRGSSQPTG